MSEVVKRQLIIEPLPGCEPEIGRMLWMMEDARRRTLKTLDGIEPQTLDWQPPANGNSIGTLLYHIAAIEMDWLAVEVMENRLDKSVWDIFSVDVRDTNGRLTVVSGVSLEAHYQRLDAVRALLLDCYKALSVDDFRRPRRLPDYDVSPEEVLHHLMQHEAEHRGEMATIRTLAEAEKF
ncbi:MAG: DinB family protein [Chloroflexota bacterium]